MDFEYFRAVLFDSIKEDFDWYVEEIQRQFERQEKEVQLFMHVISLVYRLREFLLIPTHSLIARTKL